MVSIAESSMAYLGLEIGKFQRRDYFQNIRVPAEIVERIPEGRRHITSTFQGRIKQVYVTKGQAVAPGDKLFELRVMDNELSASQVELLDTLSKLEANEKQLARLKPLVESGVVAGKRILEFQLEKEKLQQKKEALSQGLDIQGMDADQLKKLITEQQLFRVVTVTAPPLKPDFQASEPRQDAELKFSSVALSIAPNSETGYFTVESISALEGANIKSGDSLCELTHHGSVLVKGMAYETDMEKIGEVGQKGWSFTAEFGDGFHGEEAGMIRDGLQLFQIENHVDEQSQTYPVYVELNNEIINEHRDELGRRFINWRFKPGQRSHLIIPITQWQKQWVVPRESVVFDGPQAFVFQKVNHIHEGPDGVMHEFAKTPVKVLHQDRKFFVLEKSELIKSYERYALDQAYQLNLILKSSANEGGGGHAHPHPH